MTKSAVVPETAAQESAMADADQSSSQSSGQSSGQSSTQFGFQAEVAKLLHMMTHSVYSHREVFLRELISNAADACDRRRYAALTAPELLGEAELEVVVTADPQGLLLSVADSGIGMSRQELIDNLGTIARSGTQRFMEAAQGARAAGAPPPDLIGQFGVGFYASFMIADKVSVTSRAAGSEEAWVWESDGLGTFTLAPGGRDAVGTTIVLHLKDDAREFADKPRLEQIIRTYSDHIAIPVKLGVAAEIPAAVNTAGALWTRPRSEISEQDYAGFYRHIAGQFDTPLRTLHFRAEGKLDYTALLFVPGMPPYDLYDPVRASRLKLYVKRVFITDDCAALAPPWLRFLRGVVDAQDLSLNLSRETLQNNPVLAAMKKAIAGKVLADLAKLARDDATTYDTLWTHYGRVLKEGLYEDLERRDDLLRLARFRSTHGEGWHSLADYVGRMKPDQTAIYYLAADATAPASPQLEGFTARGLEVLLLSDPIDDFWAPVIHDFEGKALRSITQAEAAELGAAPDEPQGEAASEADMARLVAVMKGVLGDAVKDIRASARLTTSAVCLVAGEGGADLRLARMLKAHDRLHMAADRILELNPRHDLIRRLAARSGDTGKLDLLTDASHLLLDQALILEGEALPDPAAFARRQSAVLLAMLDAA